MKLRTDFVTNSSSSSFVTLHIKSKPLAQLFAKYEEVLNDFFSPDRDFYGELNISSDRITLTGGVPDGELGDDVPKTTDDIAWCVASLLTYGNVTEPEQIDEGEFDEALEDILRELFAQAEVLSDSVESVRWESGTEGHSEYDGSYSHCFTYDPENGPSYTMEEVPGMDDEDF